MSIEKDIKSLEARIELAMKNIKKGETTPKDSGIGKMFSLIKEFDAPAYERLFEEYKPISKEWFDKYYASPEYEKIKEEEEKIKREIKRKAEDAAIALKSSGGGEFGGFDDDASPRKSKTKEAKPVKQKIAKIKTPKLPKASTVKGERDRTVYQFNGETYKKGPLVLAVIRQYVRENPKVNYVSLKKAFPDELLKGYGVFQTYDKAMDISKVRKRFFLNDNQLVRLPEGNIAICSQFAVDTISPFLSNARKLGYKID